MIPKELIIAAVAVALFAGYTWFIYDMGGDHRENAIIADAARQKAARQGAAQTAAEQTEADRARQEEINRVLDEGVDGYVATDAARDACFDDAGFVLFNSDGASSVHVPGAGHAAVPARSAQGARPVTRRDSPGP